MIIIGELSKLPNISKVLEGKLNEAGINTQKQLISIGSRQAFLHIKKNDSGACINMLCALEGSIQGIRWHDLSDKDEQDLKKFHKLLKREKE